MSNAALLIIIIAALLHASWNYVLKRSGGGLGILALSAATAGAILTPIAFFMIWQGFSFTWPIIGMVVGSGIIHIGYFLLLDRAYRSGGDLSVVYPLARATGPLLTIIAATLFFGERMTPIALAGAVLIGVSALVLTGDPRRLFSRNKTTGAHSGASFALLCGCVIAAYTVWDKQAVALFLIPPLIFDWAANLVRIAVLVPYARHFEPNAMTRAWRQHKWSVIAIGIMSPLSYILVLTAMVTTPVSYIAPAREMSILFAALLGAHILKEGDATRRTIAAIGMVLGVGGLAVG